MCYRWHYLLEMQLSPEELEFPARGEMLFHSPSVDVSSTANISMSPWKQVGLKTTFPIKKFTKKNQCSSLPFSSETQNQNGEIYWPLSRSLTGLPRVHLHVKDNPSSSVSKTSAPKWLGIKPNFLEFAASLSCIYPPGKSEIIEDVQCFASFCEVNQNRGNVFP